MVIHMLREESTKSVSLLDKYSDKSVTWLHCPRCISGNMYAESNHEHVCLQCGYHHYPNSTTDTAGLLKIT
jgi:uncharacterized protein (DUF983 family)